MIFGLFKSSPEREGRRLHKDVATILEMARQTYRESILEATARTARDGIAHLDTSAGDDAARIARELSRFKTLHREARRRNDQVGLTAYTLVIIHARAGELGPAGQPARDTIASFIDEWPGDPPPQDTLAG